jgi:hypothetical protein
MRSVWAAILLAFAAVGAAPADAQAPTVQQVSVDTLTGEPGQHETAVEPDSFGNGETVVAAFQVGRTRTAGAAAIGWATSSDGGSTWSSGLLPTGSYTRVTDPSVAYDSAHAVWLVTVLALQDGPGGTEDELLSAIVTSRSPDGIAWGAPVVTSPVQTHFAHDKNWVVCDNGTTSRYRGRCYVVWTAVAGPLTVLGISTSTDGGATWSPERLVPAAAGSGWQPVVQPDGKLVIVYVGGRALYTTRSTDGGTTFSDPVLVASLQDSPTPGWRAPSLPSAEMDAHGRITVAWADCRFRPGCGRPPAVTDIVVSSSADGIHWSRVRRVPTGIGLDGAAHFVVGLAVDPSTSGTPTRLGLVFHALSPPGCTTACAVVPYFSGSTTDGHGWTPAEALAPARDPSAFPQADDERFLGDYTSASFVAGGISVVFFASAAQPYDGQFHQGIFAASLSPQTSAPTLRVGVVAASPRRPRPRERLVTSLRLAGLTSGAVLSCRRDAPGLSLLARAVRQSRATCTWQISSRAAGKHVSGVMRISTPEAEATRRFALRVRGR